MNLKELSNLLGLSQTTVSRALNGFPEVSESTRERVQQVAREKNYTPNKAARGLATGQSFAIGHVLSTTGQSEIVNPVFGDFVAGVGEVYSNNGYKMLLTIVSPEEDEHQVYRTLKAEGTVDAVVLHSPTMNDDRISFLTELKLPFIVHGRSSQCKTPYAWLDVNNRSAFERATNFLHDLGHRRIALLNGLEHMDFAHRRRDGFESVMRANDLPIDPRFLCSDEMTESYGFNKTSELLKLDNPPTALLTSSTLVALGARQAIQDSGKIVGKDVSIVTHDDCLSYLHNDDAIPNFTATKSSVRHAGRRLAALLLQMVSDPNGDLPQELLEVELTIGKSTGPAPL